MNAATDCISFDEINKLCLDTGWECSGKCEIYFPEGTLGIPEDIEDADIPGGIVD